MALDMVRVTDALPVLSAVAWEDVPYTPELLLDASSLPVVLVNDAAFALGCENGYDGYFECDKELSLLSSTDVLTAVHGNVLGFLAPGGTSQPFPWYAGFSFGWLSAFAKYQPAEAEKGVQVLSSLVSTIQRCNYTQGVYGCRAGRMVGTDGWPLDM
ncbi:MAG: hypothetical protein H0V70_22995 [Ktedonobacteraceae bacterium]|nr:hypothetical protein [Ktedonobacteraceae bacterium]